MRRAKVRRLSTERRTVMADSDDGSSSADELSDFACDVSLNADRNDGDEDGEDQESYDDFDVIYVADENKVEPLKDVDVGNEAEDLEERLKDQPHPMLIPEIVQTVASYLDPKTMESLRPVCRTWNTEFCKVLRRTRRIEFVDTDSIGRYNRRMGLTRDFPHTQFDMMLEDLQESELNTNEFFRKFGPHLKSLKLAPVTLNSALLFQILQTKAPNLESLIIYNHPKRLTEPEVAGPSSSTKEPVRFVNLKSVQFHVRGAHSAAFTKDLLSLAPNLVKISHLRTCTGAQPEPDTVSRGTVLMNAILESEAPLNHLSYLDFRFTLSESMIESFRTKSFPLVFLDAVVDGSVKEKSLITLVDTFQRTLCKLELTFTTASSWFRFSKGSSLSCITSLTLYQYKGNLMFVQDMPQLRYLKVDVPSLADAFNAMGFQKNLGPNGHQLTSFITKNDASDDLLIKRIATYFPNLKELGLGMVTDEGLNVIYRDLPFITELYLTQGTFTDSGISGVPAEVIKDLWETRTYYYVKPEQFRRSLYLGCLTNLYKVSLESDEMTDLAVIFGIVGCNKLRSLRLKSKKVTDQAMPTIGQSLRGNLTSVDVSGCSEITEAGKYLLKQKQPSICVITEVPRSTTQCRFIRRIVSSEFDERENNGVGGAAHRLPAFRFRDEDLPHLHLHQFLRDRDRAFRRLNARIRHRMNPAPPARNNNNNNNNLNAEMRRILDAADEGDDDDDLDDLFQLGFHQDAVAVERLRVVEAEARHAAELLRQFENGQIPGPHNAADHQQFDLHDVLAAAVADDNNEMMDDVLNIPPPVPPEAADPGNDGIPPTPPPNL